VFFLETAQQLLFAQQFGLQPSALGAFERMHEAAGSWSGLTNIASTTANRIVAVFRMAGIYHKGPGASTLAGGLSRRSAALLSSYGIGTKPACCTIFWPAADASR
jgi:hypothetical protein